MGDRLARLDAAIDRLVGSAPGHMQAVIAALQALRGVAKLTAVTIVTEVGTFQRFQRATDLMGNTGQVPSENSSGNRQSKGGITHAGNAHLRHVLGEAAWHARDRPWLNNRLKKLLPTLPAGVAEIAIAPFTMTREAKTERSRAARKGEPSKDVVRFQPALPSPR